ncbi:MAG: hypothetical protein Q9177_005355 [Variospora cf. flavescens]
MDEASAELISQLLLDDMEDFQRRAKGKGKEGDDISDADLALQLQHQEYKVEAMGRADRRMALSHQRAVQDDGASVMVQAGEERSSATDRQMACQLGGQSVLPHPQAAFIPPASFIDTNDDILARMNALNFNNVSVGENQVLSSPIDEAGESSAWAAGRRPPTASNGRDMCNSCLDVKLTVQLPCHHRSCQKCTIQLFTAALSDESLFPLRCCGKSIPMSLVRPFLGPGLTNRMEKKAIEYTTTNRTYCHEPSCATFIEPGQIHGSTGACPRELCGRLTCVLCKNAVHEGDCPPRDDGVEEALQLAQASGWQRCGQCQNVVELNIGCNHITYVLHRDI